MQLPYYIDLLGTLVFAISGALAASDKNVYRDIFGVTFTGFVTAVGIAVGSNGQTNRAG